MKSWRWPLLAGLLFALVDTILVPFLLRTSIDSGLGVPLLLTFASVWAGNALVWWLVITRPGRPVFARLVWAAVLGTLLSMLIVYTLTMVFMPPVAMPDGLLGVGYRLTAIYGFTIGRFLLIGWLLAVLNGALGLLLIRFERRSLPADASAPPPRRRGVVLGTIGAIGVVLLSLVVWVWVTPVPSGQIQVENQPIEAYAAASTAVQALQAADDAARVNPLCRSKFLTHGEKTAKTIVLLHGYSSCPQQQAGLAQLFYDRGYNVLVPRLPHHGLADRMTPDLEKLTAEELVQFGNHVVDIAQGLGDQVTVAGFSAGGTLASWLAQTRPDIDSAVMMAPLFGSATLPTFLVQPLANLMHIMPNQFTWWDPVLRDTPVPPLHAYPRYSTRGAGEILRLALLTRNLAGNVPPAAKQLLVITNPADDSVSNPAIDEVVGNWRQHEGVNLRTYAFPVDWKLIHDFIDPTQEKQQVERVYPVLMEQIAGAGG